MSTSRTRHQSGAPINPVAEVDASGETISTFVYGTGINVPDYMVRGGTRYYFVRDHLGSVRFVVDASGGSVAQELRYDEFGQVTFDSNPGFQPFGYAGGLYDPKTGLVRFGARDYDPHVGRWTAPDPIGFGSRQVNLFVYVGNGLISLSDPFGLWEFAVGFEVTISEVLPHLPESLAPPYGGREISIGIFGAGIEYTSSGGLRRYTIEPGQHTGVGAGLACTGNVAMNAERGARWDGWFRNFFAGAGPVSGSYFRGGGWHGVSIGPSVGLPAGAGVAATKYTEVESSSVARGPSISRARR